VLTSSAEVSASLRRTALGRLSAKSINLSFTFLLSPHTIIAEGGRGGTSAAEPSGF